MRFFFQSIDDAGDPVLDQDDMEVDWQAKSLAGKPEVRTDLISTITLSSTIRPARKPA